MIMPIIIFVIPSITYSEVYEDLHISHTFGSYYQLVALFTLVGQSFKASHVVVNWEALRERCTCKTYNSVEWRIIVWKCSLFLKFIGNVPLNTMIFHLMLLASLNIWLIKRSEIFLAYHSSNQNIQLITL